MAGVGGGWPDRRTRRDDLRQQPGGDPGLGPRRALDRGPLPARGRRLPRAGVGKRVAIGERRVPAQLARDLRRQPGVAGRPGPLRRHLRARGIGGSRGSVLGENSLAVSYSPPRRRIRRPRPLSLARRDVQLGVPAPTAVRRHIPTSTTIPAVLQSNPYYPRSSRCSCASLSRPSAASGRKYAEVSRRTSAPSTRSSRPAEAPRTTGSLERELVWITGFPVRAWEGSRSPSGRTAPRPAKTPPVRGERSPSPR